ncbi:MAG: LPS export ABC transporter periplasmic protein LptC [Alphaproteobacteria bacterium]|nr:LPS export ABC transporter periplasmic protein LptC [Alphaproteobacteria bacterium]
MKKNKIIQFSLVIVGIILFFFTYYSSDKDKIVDIDKNILVGGVSQLTKEISNIIENVEYVGSNNKGTFFELNAAIAEIKYDNPNISYLQDVFVVIKLSNLRTIRIRSDKAVFNKISNDCEFFGNVEIIEQDDIITSDNLDLYMSKNLITVYNHVQYNGIKGFLIADKMDIDMLKNEANIFMFNKKNKVQVKYKN